MEAPTGPMAGSDTNEHNQELANQQQALSGLDISKPSRAPPKVFASPKKTNGKHQGSHGMTRKHSMRSKLRKALAPYLTSSYLQGEMAKRFTEEYIGRHPPPANEEELPGYIQHHLHELNRVTERWSGCVVKALDPLSHQMAIDNRLQRERDREEGIGVESVPHSAKTRRAATDDFDVGLDDDGGLTSSQLFSAVHLVSDIKVWQQILAAQQAEERRQHAIAELHLNHAAKIIQRSWQSFITNKREEQARLDALVSPDVQAMLSAAAYKAMRDARTKLTIMKLRKSLSRKARGFGSTAPRDLDPIPHGAASRKNLLPGAGLDSIPQATASRKNLLPGAGLDSIPRGAASRKNLLPQPQPQPPSQNAPQHRSTAVTLRAQLSPVSSSGSVNNVDGVGSTSAAMEVEDGSELQPASRPGGSGVLTNVKSFAARSAQIIKRLVSMKEPAGFIGSEGKGSGRGMGEEENDDGHVRREGHDGEMGDEVEGLASEDTDGDGEFVSESAEGAMAEAEEVVQMAAELANTFLGTNEDSEYGESDDDGSDDSQMQMDEEALRALSAVEAAAAVSSSMDRLLAPPPLQAAAQAAAAMGPMLPRPPAASMSASRRPGGMSDETALIRQVLAGALAAAAAPVLGRKNALAMAQLGLGDLLPNKGISPRAAAARLRPAPGYKLMEEQLATVKAAGAKGAHHPQPLEIRAAAVLALGVNAPVNKRRGSEGGINQQEHGSTSGALSKPARHPARNSVPGNGGGSGGVSESGRTGDGAGTGAPRNPGGSGALFLPTVHVGAHGLAAIDTVYEDAGSGSMTAESTTAAWRYPPGSSAESSGRDMASSYPPGANPTTISAAAAAAQATQPWATRRPHQAPPGARTMAGSIPDPRGGSKDTGPREPTWLLPPIGINRSSTGPAGLGGIGASGAASTNTAAGPGPRNSLGLGVMRTASDPNLQRLVGSTAPPDQQQRASHLQAGAGGGDPRGGGNGGGGPAAAHTTGVAPLAVARARRSSMVGGSLDRLLPHYFNLNGIPGVLSQSTDASVPSGAKCGFVINGNHGGNAAHVARPQLAGMGDGVQLHPLPSALAGGGGGAGGGTAAARQVVHHVTSIHANNSSGR